MKRILQGGIAVLLAFSLIISNLWSIGDGLSESTELDMDWEVVQETKSDLKTVYAADPTTTVTPTPQVTDRFIIRNQNGRPVSGTIVDYTGGDLKLSIATSTGEPIPIGTTIEWLPYDETVIHLQEDTNSTASPLKNQFIKINAVGPGYTAIRANIITAEGLYTVDCQIHVQLRLANVTNTETCENPVFDVKVPNVSEGDDGTGYIERLGMRKGLLANEKDETKSYVLQLAGPEATTTTATGTALSKYSHYLARLDYVTYKEGVKYDSVAEGKNPDGTVSGKNLLDVVPNLTWSTSNEQVATVDEFGVITAQGAGYAEITAETNTSGSGTGNQSVKDSITIRVIVVPTARLVGGSQTMRTNNTITVKNKTFTLESNAKSAENLEWTLYRDNINDSNKLSLSNNKYAKVDISSHSGAITLSDVKAGVYYLTAHPSDLFDKKNTNQAFLTYKIIVPIFMKLDHVYMNVGDIYDILGNSNLPESMKVFNFAVNGGSSNIIEVTRTTGVITALSEGNETVQIIYTGDLFPGETTIPDEGFLGEDKEIEVTVIDDVSLNHTAATIYVAGTLQLILNASNPYAPVEWTSSDETVATVDEDGLVTGVKVGDCVITATQIINGVKKQAKCEIRVKQTVTKITLDPSSAAMAVGDYLTINATTDPKNSNANLTWVSSDESIVKVAEAGNLSATVQAVAGGTVTISAFNKDNAIVGSCLIKVHKKITGITISETSVTVPLATGWFRLYATITPADAEDQEVIWRSTDPSVLTVDQTGKVTLKSAGSATVIVTSREDATISALCNIKVTKSVTGLTLDTKNKEMYVGETFRLNCSVTPSDAADTAVTWTSTNSAVASVDEKGLVTAKGVGTTVIIVKTNVGGFMALCTIRVSQTATAVKLDVTKLIMNVKDSYQFSTTLTPANSDDSSLVWESSDTKVAVVSKRGKVTAKATGTCIIMVKTKSGSTGYCTINVVQGATGVDILSDEETVYVGETIELEAEVIPNDATDQGISWSSSNPEIATVNKKGEVKGILGGTAIITCTTDDGGYTDFCVVTVEELVTDVKLNVEEYRLGLGRTYRLLATISGENATNKQVEWSSSDPEVVSVDINGRIKGLELGTATITCTATDGSGAEAVCRVEVVQLVTDIELNENYITLIQGKSTTLKATISPKNATYKTPIWSSNDEEIAIVNKKGVVTGLSAGNCIITAAADDTSGITTLCYVKVIEPVPATSITVQEADVVMSPGETKTVAISIVPNNSTDTYSWSSDNTLVASVDEKTGKITAKAVGAANITVMTESGRRATIRVHVVGLSRTYVELQQYTSLLIKLEVDGASSGEVTVRWDVDNQEIATVQNGVVTARALGTTTVYAVVNGRRLACTIKVVKIK